MVDNADQIEILKEDPYSVSKIVTTDPLLPSMDPTRYQLALQIKLYQNKISKQELQIQDYKKKLVEWTKESSKNEYVGDRALYQQNWVALNTNSIRDYIEECQQKIKEYKETIDGVKEKCNSISTTTMQVSTEQ